MNAFVEFLTTRLWAHILLHVVGYCAFSGLFFWILGRPASLLGYLVGGFILLVLCYITWPGHRNKK